jgi:hypothetical protein
MNGKMHYSRKVRGKFKYYPETKDMIEHVTNSFKKQLLRKRCDPEYVTSDTMLTGLH